MQTTNHPDDERLAALAGADPDATGDFALSEHVNACQRCAALVDDLRGLRAALSELPDPDLALPRPLRLLPPVPEPRPTLADRVGAVVRGAFAPVLTAGAALALVGAVGTTGFAEALLPGGASGPAPMAEELRGPAASTRELAATQDTGGAEASAPAAQATAGAAAPGTEALRPTPRPIGATSSGDRTSSEARATESLPAFAAGGEASDEAEGDAGSSQPLLQAERPIWPMVLFGGVALMVVALLLRWIFQPKAP